MLRLRDEHQHSIYLKHPKWQPAQFSNSAAVPTMRLTPAERLEQRSQAEAYQRVQGNLALDFVSEFLALSLPKVTTTEGLPRQLDYDLWWLGHKGHFMWWTFAATLITALVFSGYMAIAGAGARAAHSTYKGVQPSGQPSHTNPLPMQASQPLLY